MDWPTVIGAACGASVLVGGAASLYFRASISDIEKRLALVEYKTDSTAKEVQRNYEYCHDSAHEIRSDLNESSARAQLYERELSGRIAILESRGK